MPTSTPKKKPATKKATSQRSAYHHGNLREAMIEATLALIEEGGPENVSLREAAKRAGVSSGAPFRHFPNRTALMTAVAEEAMRRLRTGIVDAIKKSTHSDPLIRLKIIGYAYLEWAIYNPAHFLIISDRRLIDFDSSESLQQDNQHIQQLMSDLLGAASSHGLLRVGEHNSIPLIARALSYGLARMYIDGHMPQWGVKQGDVMRTMEAAIDQFIDGIATDTWFKSHKRIMKPSPR